MKNNLHLYFLKFIQYTYIVFPLVASLRGSRDSWGEYRTLPPHRFYVGLDARQNLCHNPPENAGISDIYTLFSPII